MGSLTKKIEVVRIYLGDSMKLSLVVPCYNEEQNVSLFYEKVKEDFSKVKFDYEIVFINDGSSDNTIDELKKLCKDKKKKIKVIDFSRNFGKEAAMYAGLKNASGDYVTIIDADLQQDPKLVLDMVKFLDENDDYDCVAAYQEERIEGKVLSFFKNSFYKLINKMSDTTFVRGASDFRTCRRRMVEAIISMEEYFRFSKGIFAWVGFKTYFIPYVAHERASGSSSWSFWKLFKYAIDGIIAFSTVPLRISTIVGLLSSVLSIIYLIVVIVQKLVFSIAIPGYATIVVLILLLGGLQLFSLGILGEYVARTYVETKKRPIYIAKEIISYEK